MWPKVVALALLLIGVALGVVGNWLKPPANMGGRAIVAVFTVLLLAAAGITYFTTEPGDSGSTQERASAGDGERTSPTSTTTAGTTAATTSSRPSSGGADDTAETGEPVVPADQPNTPQPRKPAAPKQPCIVGTWNLTTIVDYITYSDQTVALSYDSGWETRTYKADNTFTITNDWHERGYDNTLNELTTHSNGSAEGRYQLNGSTATYSPVSSVGNWTLAVNGEVRNQSSVIFSSGEETVTCTADSLKIASGSDYKASYSRK